MGPLLARAQHGARLLCAGMQGFWEVFLTAEDLEAAYMADLAAARIFGTKFICILCLGGNDSIFCIINHGKAYAVTLVVTCGYVMPQHFNFYSLMPGACIIRHLLQ